MRRSIHVEEQVINSIDKKNINNIILLFRIVNEDSKSKALKIGNTCIAPAFSCCDCCNMMKNKYPWALKMKWKTIDKNGCLINAITENPKPSPARQKAILDGCKKLY